jgi:hypothetical protein
MDYSMDLASSLQALIDDEIDVKEGLNIKLLNNIVRSGEKSNYMEIYEKKIEEEKSRKLITYKEEYENNVKINFIKQPGESGLEWINQEEIKKQRSIISYLVSKVGVNILAGKSIMNVSLPIYIFDERSLLEVMVCGMRLWPYFPGFNFKDNLERMKQSIAGLISTMHIAVSMSKPFNPILGETFQCKIKDLHIYLEQTSHHPPVHNYYVKHPKFVSFGYYSMESSTGTNSLSITQKGKSFTKFNDGVVFTYTFPPFIMHGLTVGRRMVNFQGNMTVTDLTNNLMACVRMNPDERGIFGKLFSSKSQFPDFYTGFIANVSNVKYDAKKDSYTCDKGSILAKIEGEWTNYVKIDDKIYWEHGMYPLFPMEKQAFTLPSDSLYREDLVLLKTGDQEMAQQAKTNLEEIQRNDRKLREKYSKSK